MSTVELWNNYVTAREALIEGKRIRSYRSPTTDFAEWIVSKMLNGVICDNKVYPLYDVDVKESKMKIQVKSIARHYSNHNGKTLTEKDFDNKEANYYAFVYFDKLQPKEFFLIPQHRLIEVCKPKSRITRNHLTTAVTNEIATKMEINLKEL